MQGQVESTPKEICIEDLDLPPEDERYLNCVALPDLEPGLALDSEGLVQWLPEEGIEAIFGLWVSDDDRLMLRRGADTGPIIVERGGRSVEAPPTKPVVLMDQDLLRVNGRRLRVHLHGDAEEVYAPEPVPASALARMARTAAAALSIGAVGLAGAAAEAAPGQAIGQEPTIEVRARPPSKPAPRRPVDCKITALKAGKHEKAPPVLVARCPSSPLGKRVRAGTSGQIIDPKTKQPMRYGSVRVEKVDGRNLICRTRLKTTKLEAKQVRFFVR